MTAAIDMPELQVAANTALTSLMSSVNEINRTHANFVQARTEYEAALTTYYKARTSVDDTRRAIDARVTVVARELRRPIEEPVGPNDPVLSLLGDVESQFADIAQPFLDAASRVVAAMPRDAKRTELLTNLLVARDAAIAASIPASVTLAAEPELLVEEVTKP